MSKRELHPLLTFKHAFAEWQRLGRREALSKGEIHHRQWIAAGKKAKDGRTSFNDYFSPPPVVYGEDGAA